MATESLPAEYPAPGLKRCHRTSEYVRGGRYIYGQRFHGGDSYDVEGLDIPEGVYVLNDCLDTFLDSYLQSAWLEPTPTRPIAAQIVRVRQPPADAQPVQWGSFLVPSE